jgi:hypothetical protein
MYSAQPKKMDYFRAISVLYPKLEDCIMVLLPNLFCKKNPISFFIEMGFAIY